MPRIILHTQYVYTIRRTATMSIYRSSRNPKFCIKITTLSMMGVNYV